jgi:hypothetical protein
MHTGKNLVLNVMECIRIYVLISSENVRYAYAFVIE